jgi:oxaloacetate decarboxylase gamma subunit
MTDFQTGLLLFSVGFPAVFLMLYSVILLGRGLILFVNKYASEDAAAKNPPARTPVSSGTVSAIVASVNAVTGGKGKVTRIEKIV